MTGVGYVFAVNIGGLGVAFLVSVCYSCFRSCAVIHNAVCVSFGGYGSIVCVCDCSRILLKTLKV